MLSLTRKLQCLNLGYNLRMASLFVRRRWFLCAKVSDMSFLISKNPVWGQAAFNCWIRGWKSVVGMGGSSSTTLAGFLAFGPPESTMDLFLGGSAVLLLDFILLWIFRSLAWIRPDRLTSSYKISWKRRKTNLLKGINYKKCIKNKVQLLETGDSGNLWLLL